MSINKKLIFAALTGIVFGMSSCQKFLNVNTNPNAAQAGTIQTLLPAAQLLVGTSLGVDLEIDGSFFAQYWTQSPGASQYHNLDQYSSGQDGFSTPWTNLYAAQENFYQLYKLADSVKAPNYMAISLLMQAYTYQVISDGWGDVPCSQALKGQYSDGHLVNPSYDKQMQVYDTIFSYIAQANALINPSTLTPSGDDLIYGGNMNNWVAFSNTLALKAYMRLSAINLPMAQTGIAALYATNPTFIAPGQEAFIAYGFGAANENPLYAEMVGLSFTQNLVASNTCLDTMIAENDPRINIFYEPLTQGSNNFAGIPQGLYGIPYTGYSFPSVFVGGDSYNTQPWGTYKSGNAPVNFMTSSESLFLQAEAAARGWTGRSNDDTLFFEAIAASFSYYTNQFLAQSGISGAAQYANYIAGNSYWVQYPTAGSFTQKQQYIITQKYFSMCGNQGFEAWTEWRRTGFPNWFIISNSSILGGTPGAPYTVGAAYPRRFTYPSSESTVNANFPGLQPLTAQVWWDVL